MRLTRRELLGGGLAAAAARMRAAAAPSIVIERIEIFKVIVPMRPGVVSSDNYGPLLDRRLTDFDQVPKHILKLHAANGLTGLGETGRGELDAGVAQNAAFLKGSDIRTLDFSQPSLGLPHASTADAFEMAASDLMGKTLGVPVHVLLGGRFQDKVAVTYWTGQRTATDLVAIVRRAVDLGFHHLKFKARRGDPIDKLVRAADQAAPQLGLTVDFNASYPDVASFLPVGKRLEGFNLIIEDPIPTRIDWLRRLRERLDIPLALTPRDVPHMMEAIRAQAVDIFNLGGNMRQFVRSAFLAEAAGIPVWHGSGVELGIRDISFIHAAAATRACTIASDTLCFLRQSDLLATPFRVVDGYIETPRAPGLGVELDEAAVRRFRAG